MDDRDRQMRDRDWRRSERIGRGEDYRRDDYAGGYDFRMNEGRSFGSDDDMSGRDRVFGERETGANYRTGVRPGGGAYGAGGSYGGGESYGRHTGGGRTAGQGRSGGGRDWQDPDYQGVSPAFRREDQGHLHGRGWQGRDYQGTSPGFAHGGDHRHMGADYSQGGRYYGDDDRQPIYREEYGQGGRDYGEAPRGYDARHEGWGGGERFGSGRGDYRDYRQGSVRPAYGGPTAGGTGGYDFERGYGDGGRREWDGDRTRSDDPMYRAGEFLNRAGQKISSWFRGDSYMEGAHGDDRRDYRAGGDNGWRADDRGHRGRGPKGYTRSDERIREEVCERLADDSWLDASNIDVRVEGSEVTLSGSVENRQDKHRAERVVEDISGVNHVQNNLRIVSNPITGSGTGFGDSAAAAAARRDEPAANGTGGTGSGQSTAGRKMS
jgi:hypothetical protein